MLCKKIVSSALVDIHFLKFHYTPFFIDECNSICSHKGKLDPLIDLGANLNYQYDCTSLLHLAAFNGNIEALITLISYNPILLTKTNINGSYVLHWAILGLKLPNVGIIEMYEPRYLTVIKTLISRQQSLVMQKKYL